MLDFNIKNNSLTNRRLYAALIDVILLTIITAILSFVLFLVAVAIFAINNSKIYFDTNTFFQFLLPIFWIVRDFTLFGSNSFRQSVGKQLMKIKIYNIKTYNIASAKQIFIHNLPFLILLIPIFNFGNKLVVLLLFEAVMFAFHGDKYSYRDKFAGLFIGK